MPLASPHQIQSALQQVRDQKSFINKLLTQTLQWPITGKVQNVEDLAYGWPQEDLRAAGLEQHVLDGNVWQIQPLSGNQPWGIFLLEFERPDAFVLGRGMTGPLRKVLRGLVPNRRRASNAMTWNREHLLFVCTHNYEHYRIAYFKAPPEKGALAPLAAFGWGPDVPARTACEFNLPSLTWPDQPTNAGEWVTQWTAAFDVEKVTKKFYEDYASAFEEVEGLIGAKAKVGDEEDLRMFTQTLFNRLMFLRFIERKGWLDFGGRHDYLRALFEAGGIGGKSLYQSRVRPLFFEGLAVEGQQTSKAIGTVPFLNGGLFEENELDRKAKDVPDTALSPMIGSSGLFYRYNFTIEESTPLDIEVAVDPEMLGKVFEELVTERHESGAYYTPRPVVSFMCREALKGYLSHKTAASADSVATLVDNHQLNDLSETHAREILTALDGIKAVDPACGSGAYLLGLLHELVAIYRLLYSERLTRDSRSLYDLKLRIISHNLYGVDIDPFATNIAMLRLWLSLAVEANDPVPLPNLDFKIETGDSLLGSCDHPTKGSRTQGRLDWDDLRTKADALVEMKRRYFASHGTDKISHRDEIAKEESSIAQALRSFVGHGVIDWRIQFADAFIVNSGFDVVVANPPYVDSERMTANDPDYRAELGGRFTTTRGNWDLYIPFFERGFQLLNADGAMAFITPDKWSSKPFGEALRTLVFPYLSAIVNAGRNVFTSAAVDALVCIVSGDQLADVRVFSYENGNVRYKRRVAKSGLTKPYAFDGLFSDSIGFVERLGARSGRLSELGKCENACATSDAYKLKPFIKDAATEVLGDGYLKVVNTGTIGKYRSRWGKKPMTYLGDKLLRPVVKTSEWRRHFTNSYGRKAFAAKLIVKSLTLLDACMDEKGEVVPGKSTLIVTSRDPDDLYVLLGVINCPVSLFYLKQRYPGSSYNKGITFTKDMLNDLPIPRFSGDEKKALVRLVRARMAVDNDDGDKATKLERQIAMAVCSAFGLTEEDLSDIGADGMRS